MFGVVYSTENSCFHFLALVMFCSPGKPSLKYYSLGQLPCHVDFPHISSIALFRNLFIYNNKTYYEFRELKIPTKKITTLTRYKFCPISFLI